MIATVKAVRAFAGVPFLHRGRNPDVGLDCAGIILCAYEAAGFHLVDCWSYGPIPPVSKIAETLRLNGFGTTHDIWDGDVLQIYIDESPRHLGLVDGDGFWHVEHGGQVRREPNLDIWEPRIHEVWRLF